MMPKIKFNIKVMEKAAGGGFTVSTDLAEYLVQKGLPFRDAHGISGSVVKYCIDKGKTMEDLTLTELKKFSSMIGKDISRYITLQSSINRRISHGGTSKENVIKRIKAIKGLFKA